MKKKTSSLPDATSLLMRKHVYTIENVIFYLNPRLANLEIERIIRENAKEMLLLESPSLPRRQCSFNQSSMRIANLAHLFCQSTEIASLAGECG